MTGERLLLWALIVAGALQAPLYHARLPQTVASHFDFAGAPDGWMSRAEHTAVSSGVMLVVGGILIGVFALVRRLPDRYFGMPHRDHWLAPERRASTIAYLDRRLSWIGITTIMMLIVLQQFVIRANLAVDPRLPARLTWMLLGSYLILVFVQVFTMWRTMARPDPRPGGATGAGR